MARDLWTTGNHGDVHREDRVIRLCQRAVSIDSDYAAAWALLAIGQSSRRYGFGLPGDDGVTAARKALEIDPAIPEAHCPIIRSFIEERNYAEAQSEIEKALRVDPDSWEVNKEGLRHHSRQRNFREAAVHQEKCVAVMETDYYGWGMLVSMYRALGDLAETRRAAENALDQAERVLVQNANNGAAISVAANALAALGRRDEAQSMIERGLLLDPDNLNMCYNFASVYACGLHEPDRALDLLGPTLAKASGTLLRWAEIDPDVDCLREDPRFQAMLAEAKARSSGPMARAASNAGTAT